MNGLCGEKDTAGRPAMPWSEWTTHCRVLRAQMHRIVECNFPVEYRGSVSWQWCPDDCPRVRAFANGRERKSAK